MTLSWRCHRRRFNCSGFSSRGGRRPYRGPSCRTSCWPDTYVVEKNLTNLIAEIREALDDDAAEPKFVRTIQRFGYAFRDDPKPPVGRPAAVPVAPQCRLSWLGGRAILGPGDHVIGRSPDVEVYVDAVSVSRRHACLRVAGDVVTIVDLESKNGTFVGGTRVTASRPLTNGDEIRLGSCSLTYHVLGPEIPTDTW